MSLGLSKDLSDPTHPSPTELITPMVSDGFRSPKTEIDGSGIKSPPLKSEKFEPTNSVVFSCETGIFFREDLVRYGEISLDLAKILPKMVEISPDLGRFAILFSSEFGCFSSFLVGLLLFSRSSTLTRSAWHLLKLRLAWSDSSPNRQWVDNGYTRSVRVRCRLSQNLIQSKQWTALHEPITFITLIEYSIIILLLKKEKYGD